MERFAKANPSFEVMRKLPPQVGKPAMKQYTEAEKEAILNDIRAGMRLYLVAKKHNAHARTISTWAMRAGLTTRKNKRYTEEEKKMVLDAVSSGVSNAEASKKFGINKRTAYEWVKNKKGKIDSPKKGWT